MRSLHIVGGMNRGGVETWLMHVLRHIDRSRCSMDFLVHTDQPCAYDDEIRQLGGRVIPCLHPSRPLAYARSFRRILREAGPYDVVHSHVHHFSGYTLGLAALAGVPVRVAHSHTNRRVIEQNVSLPRRLYLAAMKQAVRRYATVGLGISTLAAADLFGPGWAQDSRFKVLLYGIDFSVFEQPTDRGAMRRALGIGDDELVIGHVGSFNPVKNHHLLLRIFDMIARRQPARLMLVGDGPLRPQIEQQIREMGLSDRVLLLGTRDDVAALMQGCMDVFVFPSQYEGFGLVLLEAQAAGLPCVFSDVVPAEVDLLPALLSRVSLDAPLAAWADAAVTMRRDQNAGERLARLKASPYSIEASVKGLMEIYHG